MLKLILRYPRAFALAVMVHVAFILVIVFSLDWQSPPPMPPTEEEVVQAVAVNENEVEEELAAIRRREAKRIKADTDRVKQADREVERAKRAREKELKRLAKLEEQRKLERKRTEEASKERQQAEEDRRRAEMERQMAVEERKQAEALANAAKDEARRLEEEQRRQAEERERKKRMVEEQRRLAEQERQQKAVDQATVNKHIGLIHDQVAKKWLKPPTARTGMECTIEVRTSPVGDVLSVSVIKSSGDSVFDTRVEQAVRAAAPLQVPTQPAVYNAHFRQFKFRFKPED